MSNHNTCELCGEVLPDVCVEEVEVTYKVNGQTVLNRKRQICATCQSITVQEITGSDFFPDKYDEQCRLIPYDGKLGEHCPDCAVKKGELHQNGCDQEHCPVCGLQLLSCGHGDQVPLPEDEPPLMLTNGDVIRAIADNKKFAYYICEVSTKHKLFTADDLAEWLNAPADCVKQNCNHDTQTDLCKADNTES